ETLAIDAFQQYGHAGTVINAVVEFSCALAQGDYFLSLGIATRVGEEIVPHDRRYDAIHLQVRPNASFFGLTDLGLRLSAQQLN
uniref:Wzt carbohydrate-binding domain-containing protein n=1 Tax=uncultured Desulfobulbus sp. TaxID=239745 RepID=UPI00262FDF7C